MVGAVAFQEAQSEIVNRKANYPSNPLSEWNTGREGGQEVKHCNIGRHSLAHFSISQTIYLLYWTCGYTHSLSALRLIENQMIHNHDTYYLNIRAERVEWQLSWHQKLLLPLSCWEPRKLSLHPAWFMSGCYELVTELQMNGNEAMLWEWTISSISHGTGSHRPVFAQCHSQCIVTADTKGSEEPSFTAFVFIS